MLQSMQAVMSLHRNASLADVNALLRAHGATARAMHPGVADEALALWFELSAPSAAALAAVVLALQSHPAVDAAMLKPEGEPPG